MGRQAATGRWSSRCWRPNEDKFPTPPDLFTIADLGGWDKVTTEFFDPENGSIAEIEANLGVATE